ncbi:MAG: hypothetical protein D6688_03250 [Alphaproteobacteria bacterium]|nr:MAG: hypothetical protein D6688_03250 [Alphaproteobacteria bacterium]
MTTRSIDYGRLMHRAMRGLIVDVLSDVARDGLPGEHHFFITFDTRHPGVEMADWLRERYPDSMTIVLQHWFDALEVTPDAFGVTLNFGDQPERLVVPFDAVQTFVDPSVEFGLRFETHEAEEEPADTEEAPALDTAEDTGEGPDTQPGDAEIVSLDKFRK